jgi:NTP pyrophosphatase (non-canonical NTP hydrolase)
MGRGFEDRSLSTEEYTDVEALYKAASLADLRYPDDIDILGANIDRWADSKGWNEKEVDFGTICALFHSEISEAFEEFRNGVPLNTVYFRRDEEGMMKPEGPGVEIADLMIRVLHFAAHNNMDLHRLIQLKMCYNEQRPYKHGGKKV